jgi:hypothetical protein
MKFLANKDMRIWLAIAGTATLLIGAAYIMVQQATRLAANDAPLALAQTIKNNLESGAAANDVVPGQNIDLRSNNNLFAIVTDGTQHVLASSATLDGQSPLPPKGVFMYTAKHGSDHFTWQPAGKVRLATRVLSYGNATDSGFIITGQSLAPAEERITIYTELALAAWLAIIAWTFLVLLLPGWAQKQKRRTK